MMSGPVPENQDFEVIDQPQQLADFCSAMKGQPWIAVDTEFMRERTYYPKLCLVQVGIPGRAACIDPQQIDDLGPLLDLLYDESIIKVLHACSQDLEIFAHLENRVPGPIFDTQLAAPLLGLPEQMGYGNFVQEILGVSLDKAQARTDWSHRPLSAAQLSYAADDVRYLAQLYPLVRDRLEEGGRLDWLAPEFERFERLERYRPDPDTVWKRIRGLEKLRPRALAILQSLAGWRERTAQEKNLPRSWVLKDDALFDIARLAPATAAALGKIRNLQPKIQDRYGERILSLVGEAKEREPQALPEAKRKGAKPSAQQEAMADLLHAQLRLLADHYSINCSVLASRKDLIALVQGREDIPVLDGWRHQMAGRELLALRDGKRDVRVQAGQVVIDDGQGSVVAD